MCECGINLENGVIIPIELVFTWSIMEINRWQLQIGTRTSVCVVWKGMEVLGGLKGASVYAKPNSVATAVEST